MTHHAGDRTLEALEGPDDTDRAEKTGDDVVEATEIEVRHVGAGIVARGVFQPRSAQIALVDVDAIERIMVLEEFRVRAGAARNIEDGARAGYNLIDQAAQAVTFTRVILEMIDRVVKLRAVYEHVGTRHAFAPSS